MLLRVRGVAGTIEFLSAAFAPLTGWSASEWIGRPFAELVYADDLPRAIDKYTAILGGVTPAPYELRIRTKDGGFVVGEFHSAPLVEQGQVAGAQGIARDITDRKRAEETHQATEERLRTLFESADEALCLVEGDVFVDLNPKCLEMFGVHHRSDMLGHSPVDYSPPLQPDGRDSREKAQAYILAALQGRPQRFYWKHARKDGSTFDAEVSLNALTLHGRAHLQAIVRDITDRRAAEQAMRESEERFRLLSEAAFEGIAITEEGKIVDCNEDLAGMLGYAREEMVGKPVLDFVAFQDAGRVAEQQRAESVERYEHLARRKDGTTFHVEVQGRSLPYQGRKLRVSALRDISARRRADLLQGAIFRISEAAHTALSLQELFAAIHRIVGELMPARNFYIALCDAECTTLRFPYFVDEYDEPPAPKPPGKGLTEYVLRTGQPLLATPEVYRDLERDGEVELIGAPSVDWLGVPLVAAGETTGVLVVQTYTEGVRYSEGDRDLLQFVSAQIAMAVQKKRAEEGLRESEERYGRLFEHMREGLAYCRMLYVDGRPQDFVYLAVNAAFGRLTGLNDVVGRKVSEVIPGIQESDPQLFAIYGRVASGGAEERFETYVNALQQWLSISVFSPQAEHFVAVFEVITDRKRTEEALRGSEAKYRSLVEHAVFGIYRSSLDGRLLAANPALVAMLGYGSEEELLTVDMARDLYADPAERQRLVAQHRDAARINGVEVDWRRKDGTPIVVRLSGRPIHSADGAPDGFEMVAEDVTERRTLEAQVRQAQKMEAIGALAGGVAHDFNNLLTAVLASSNLLEVGLVADSPLRDDVETIIGAAQRGAELTRKLLAFGRRQALDLRPLSVRAVVANFARLARRVVPENVELVLQLTPEEETISADPGALEQILMNLVTNARDAMPTGGRILIAVDRGALDEEHRRTYGWGKPGAYVTLAVSDTGIGMDAEIRQRIFEPFFTTKPMGQGTGLGMSMVFGLVKQHEGFVHVYSEVGQGTTVRLYFPAVAGAGAEPVQPAAPEVRGGTETILLVEDDEAVRRAASRVLAKFGYRVLTANDGREALEIFQSCERPPDLIVSDVIMPHITGPQLLSKLREAGPVPKMLFASGYSGREALEHAELEPGVRLLPKPWTIYELLRMVREVLDAPAASWAIGTSARCDLVDGRQAMPGVHGEWYGVRCHKCGSNIPLAQGGAKAERYTHPGINRIPCPNKHCGFRDFYKFPDELVRLTGPPEP